MNTIPVFVRTTPESTVLFWDKPLDASYGEVYQLYCGNSLIQTSSETFFRLVNLKPESNYSCSIFRNGSLMAEITVQTSPAKRRIDVTAPPFSACPNGTVLNTCAIQKALDQCGPDEEVYFPPGIYLTGALRLHSNMTIHLDEGAVLQGSSFPKDYLPRIHSRFEGIEMECYQSLLNLGTLDRNSDCSCYNVLIYGKGTISGGGSLLAERTIEEEKIHLKDYLAENSDLVASCETDRTIPGRARGRLINLSCCQNVHISGLRLQNSASWNVHMIYCNNIVTDHCTFYSEGIWNGDGWDPDSSKNCTLFACEFYTEDDSVAIKSGKNPEGNLINKPCSHIRIFSCKSAFGHGICIGSEMSGGVSDVHIWDCDIANSSNGIEIKATPKRGGFVRNIFVRDCHFPRLLVHSVPYNDDGIPAPCPPVFENLQFERISFTGRVLEHGCITVTDPVEIEGFLIPGYETRKIALKDCSVPAGSLLHISQCSDLQLEGMKWK